MLKFNLILVLCLSFGGIGCAGTFKPPSAQELSPFLEDSGQMSHDDRVPFTYFWINQPTLETLKKKFTKVAIAPVNTEYLNKATEAPSLSSDEVINLASYTKQSFKDALESKDRNLQLLVVDSSGAKTFLLELALLEVDPTDALLEGTEDIAGLFIPGGLLISTTASAAGAIAAHEIGKGGVRLGLKFKNGETSELLAKIYDTREDRAALLFNANDFSVFGNAHENIDECAKEFAELLKDPASNKISSPSEFSLILW